MSKDDLKNYHHFVKKIVILLCFKTSFKKYKSNDGCHHLKWEKGGV